MSTLERLVEAARAPSVDALLQEFDFSTNRQNQMLFFIKPEVFLLDEGARAKTIGLIFDRLAAFGLEVRGAYLMSAETLERQRIMDRHYGYINQVSRTASASLSEVDQVEARRLCEVDGAAAILGGHEVLAADPRLTARALDELWASKKSKKVRSGFYVETFDVKGAPTVIVNGFHPYQLEHFTGAGRRICLLLLNSDLPWRLLRARMLGDTFPERAVAGSIRGDLNRNANEYGFAEVTIANNCAHMSAGAFEAVFELKNFLSDVTGVGFTVSQSRLADFFRDRGLNEADLERAITNPTGTVGAGENASLFDVTEEIDAQSAAATCAAFFP